MLDSIMPAKEFAMMMHRGQKYADIFPYAVHLQAVESILLRYGIVDKELREAAWLHDVLEDTGATFDVLQSLFGDRVAKCVGDVTEPKGGNRKWRHDQQYPIISRNEDAVIIKLADRLSHVEFGGKLVSMYKKEHESFKQGILPDEPTKGDVGMTIRLLVIALDAHFAGMD